MGELRSFALVLLFVQLAACSLVLDTDSLREADVRNDAAVVDARILDSGALDAGRPDAGPADSGVSEPDAWIRPECIPWLSAMVRVESSDEVGQQTLVLPEADGTARPFTILDGDEVVAEVTVPAGEATVAFSYRSRLFQSPLVVRREDGCEVLVDPDLRLEREQFDGTLYAIVDGVGNTDISNTGDVVFTRRQSSGSGQPKFVVLWRTAGADVRIDAEGVETRVRRKSPRISDDGQFLAYLVEGAIARYYTAAISEIGVEQRAVFGPADSDEAADGNMDLRVGERGYHVAFSMADGSEAEDIFFGTSGDDFDTAVVSSRVAVGRLPRLHVGEMVNMGYVAQAEDSMAWVPAMLRGVDTESPDEFRPPCINAHFQSSVIASASHLAFVGTCEGDDEAKLHLRATDDSESSHSLSVGDQGIDSLIAADDALETFLLRSESAFWVVRRSSDGFLMRQVSRTEDEVSDNGAPDTAALSPDGRWLSYTLQHPEDNEVLFVHRLRVQ